MEAKKFISTLKGFRTRFTNKPNAELEKKSVTNITEKFGGKLEAIATLNENNETELKDYLKKVLGLNSVKASDESKPAEVKKMGQVFNEDEKGKGFAYVDGKLYQVDTIKKTMKRVYKDFKDIDIDAVETMHMSMQVYQRYLRDKFPGEDAPIKKGKLYFRGYRISCDAEHGFIIEDTQKKYEVVATPFEGIPTPKELGDWFTRPAVKHTPEELQKSIERGKELMRQEEEEYERRELEAEKAAEEPDYEALRRKVLSTIKDIRSKTVDFDPTKFPDMIPFRRWKRQVNSLLTQWKNRKIRYAKFINELERITTEETFVIKEKNHRSSFKGTLLPDFKTVGSIVGDKIEVDGKLVDAVPFLTEYLLCKQPKAMSQLMKFATGEITVVDLIKNPLEVDWKVEYKKRALQNTEYNVRVLGMLYDAVDVTMPSDILFDSDLKVGDRIAMTLDGELKYKVVSDVSRGIFISKSVGYLLKHDRWIKMPKNNE